MAGFTFRKGNNSPIKNNFIPTDLKDAPVGVAPMIPTEFLIEERDFCAIRPFLRAIVYVHTAIMNTEMRAITRATLGRASDEVGVIFVVGIAKNKREEDLISTESLTHRAIVQGNYTDIYQFLVYKNLNALYWIVKNRKQAKWMVQADDDVLLDVTKFLDFTYNVKGNYSRKIFGTIDCGSRINRNNSKWVVSEEYLYKYNPIYCHGNIWFATIEAASLLLDAAPLVKYMLVDDVYVTGLLTERAGVRRYHTYISDGFRLEDVGKLFGWKQYNRERIKHWNYIVSYYMNKNY